jgi:flagellar L-ring protein precursor FlgH
MHNNLLLIIAVLLTGCFSNIERLQDVGKAPALQTVTPPPAREDYQPVPWPKDMASNEERDGHSYPNSLWQPGSRTFFRDQRTRRVGDIIKVMVQINDQAALGNTTERKRTNKESLDTPTLYGMEKKFMHAFVPGGMPGPDTLLDVTGANNYKGEGTIARSESVNTQIAAMITQILPNGNLVLRGNQEIRVNYELREITVSGIVRPEDINVDNSISSTQIAEARISYGGRGQLFDVQQPRVGNQIIDILSPF